MKSDSKEALKLKGALAGLRQFKIDKKYFFISAALLVHKFFDVTAWLTNNCNKHCPITREV